MSQIGISTLNGNPLTGGGFGQSSTTVWTDNNTCYPGYPYPQQPSTGGFVRQQDFTIRDFTIKLQEPYVSLKSKQYAVVAVGTNQVVGAHDDEAEAVSHASRLAAKNDGEYIVLKPVRLLRQKPVDIEDLPL